jgi:flagellar FliL protein
VDVGIPPVSLSFRQVPTMADDDADDEELDEDAEGDEDGSKPGGKKKLLIIVGLALLLVVGGVAAAYFTGLLQPVINMVLGRNEGASKEVAPPVFYELPEMLVNINTSGRKATFLKIKVALELKNKADIPKIEAVMPRVIDNFQVYLRELRIEDLKGSAGMYRLREELLTRVSAAVAPVKVDDVLFKEMLVQ